MRIKSPIAVYSNAAFFGCTGLFIFLLVEMDTFNVRFSFVAITLLLLIYLVIEVARIRRVQPERWLLNPAVFCALMTFVMGYGMTNVLFFLPPEALEPLGMVPEVLPSMVKHMFLVLLGALALFLGYWSPLAMHWSRPAAVVYFQRRYLPGTNTLKPWALPVLVAVALVVRLYAIKSGIYGFNSTKESLADSANYSQYIAMASGLGKLALILAALQVHDAKAAKRRSAVRWLIGIVVIEVALGFISGFKSAVALPFVLLGLCQYLRTGQLNKQYIALAFVAITVAYAVIEPYRDLRSKETGELTSVTTIVDLLMRGASGKESKRNTDESESTTLAIAARSNLTRVGAFGIEYADTHPELPAGSPAFLGDLFLAPLYAWVPRFLWSSKPMGNLGAWYNQVVLGASLSSNTSVAMGPFAYLYFAGGYLAVAVVFFLIGMLQRTFLFVLTPFTRSSGTVVFLSILQLLGTIDSSILGLLITLFRDVPILLVVMLLIYQRRAPSPPGRLGIPTRDPRYHALRHGSAG
jgi:hypothetical protein